MLNDRLVLPVLPCNGCPLELLLVGFHLSQGFHEGYAVRQDVRGPACLHDVGQVFVQLIKVLSEVLVLLVLGHVHEEVEDPCLALGEALLQTKLAGGSDVLGSAKVQGVPLSVSLTTVEILITSTAVLEKLVEELNGQHVDLVHWFEI